MRVSVCVCVRVRVSMFGQEKLLRFFPAGPSLRSICLSSHSWMVEDPELEPRSLTDGPELFLTFLCLTQEDSINF